jgi:hypothetical protein
MGTSLKDIRRGIGDKTGDLLVLEATEDAASVRTFTDAVRMGERGDNAPSIMGRIGYFSGGTEANLGHEVRITAFQSNVQTLSFRPDAPSAPVEGDELELWSISDRVGGIGALHRMVNDAIRAVRDIVGTETYATAETFSAYNPYITVPDTFFEIGGVEWADTRGYRADIRKDHTVIRGGQRTLELTKRARWMANGRTIQIWGYERAAALTDDDDETDVDAEWIVESVAAEMALAQSWKATDRAAEERRANFWASRADLYRRKVGVQRRGWGLRVP